MHVINYLIFDKHSHEFKISNGNNKSNTNQSVNILSSVTVERLFFQSVCWISQSVNQSVSQSVTLRAQIFAKLIFRIYNLIRKIAFHKFKKYPIFSDKNLFKLNTLKTDQKINLAKKFMTNKKFHRNSNICLTPETEKSVILEWSYIFSCLLRLYSYLLLLILKKSCVSWYLHRWMCPSFCLSFSL